MLPSPLTHALLWLSAASTRHPEAVLSLGTSAVVRDWNPPRYPQVPPRPTQSQQHSGTHSAARSTATLRSQAGRAMGDKGIFLWAGGRGQGSRGASEQEGVRGPGNVRTAAMPLRSASAERRPARPGIFQMPDPCHGVSPGGSHSLGACGGRGWLVLAAAVSGPCLEPRRSVQCGWKPASAERAAPSNGVGHGPGGGCLCGLPSANPG